MNEYEEPSLLMQINLEVLFDLLLFLAKVIPNTVGFWFPLLIGLQMLRQTEEAEIESEYSRVGDKEPQLGF